MYRSLFLRTSSIRLRKGLTQRQMVRGQQLEKRQERFCHITSGACRAAFVAVQGAARARAARRARIVGAVADIAVIMVIGFAVSDHAAAIGAQSGSEPVRGGTAVAEELRKDAADQTGVDAAPDVWRLVEPETEDDAAAAARALVDGWEMVPPWDEGQPLGAATVDDLLEAFTTAFRHRDGYALARLIDQTSGIGKLEALLVLVLVSAPDQSPIVRSNIREKFGEPGLQILETVWQGQEARQRPEQDTGVLGGAIDKSAVLVHGDMAAVRMRSSDGTFGALWLIRREGRWYIQRGEWSKERAQALAQSLVFLMNMGAPGQMEVLKAVAASKSLQELRANLTELRRRPPTQPETMTPAAAPVESQQ